MNQLDFLNLKEFSVRNSRFLGGIDQVIGKKPRQLGQSLGPLFQAVSGSSTQVLSDVPIEAAGQVESGEKWNSNLWYQNGSKLYQKLSKICHHFLMVNINQL